MSFLDQNVDTILTSSGHYTVPISRTEQLLDNLDSTVDSEKVILIINDISSKSHDEKKQNSKETSLPVWSFQFGKIKILLQSANIYNKLIEERNNIEEHYNIYLKYKKPKLRPVVGFSLSTRFQCCSSQLERYGKGSYFTHYRSCKPIHCSSCGKVYKTRNSSFIKNWIAIFGASKTILSVNGGEFNNKLLCELCEQFNISVKSTAAEAPWSNGIVKQHMQC